MRQIVDALARLDWFERLDAALKHLAGVRSWRFQIPRACGWSGHQIEQHLLRYGVRVWDRRVDEHCLTFRVKRQQADWAEYLLCRAGVPILGRLFNPRNRPGGPLPVGVGQDYRTEPCDTQGHCRFL